MFSGGSITDSTPAKGAVDEHAFASAPIIHRAHVLQDAELCIPREMRYNVPVLKIPREPGELRLCMPIMNAMLRSNADRKFNFETECHGIFLYEEPSAPGFVATAILDYCKAPTTTRRLLSSIQREQHTDDALFYVPLILRVFAPQIAPLFRTRSIGALPTRKFKFRLVCCGTKSVFFSLTDLQYAHIDDTNRIHVVSIRLLYAAQAQRMPLTLITNRTICDMVTGVGSLLLAYPPEELSQIESIVDADVAYVGQCMDRRGKRRRLQLRAPTNVYCNIDTAVVPGVFAFTCKPSRELRAFEFKDYEMMLTQGDVRFCDSYATRALLSMHTLEDVCVQTVYRDVSTQTLRNWIDAIKRWKHIVVYQCFSMESIKQTVYDYVDRNPGTLVVVENKLHRHIAMQWLGIDATLFDAVPETTPDLSVVVLFTVHSSMAAVVNLAQRAGRRCCFINANGFGEPLRTERHRIGAMMNACNWETLQLFPYNAFIQLKTHVPSVEIMMNDYEDKHENASATAGKDRVSDTLLFSVGDFGDSAAIAARLALACDDVKAMCVYEDQASKNAMGEWLTATVTTLKPCSMATARKMMVARHMFDELVIVGGGTGMKIQTQFKEFVTRKITYIQYNV